MRANQVMNRARNVPAEDWMAAQLSTTKYCWTRQAMWGYRLFDFWCHKLGTAVEVDGPEHDIAYDNYRDRYNWCRSAIVVLRVRNFVEEDAAAALAVISQSESWPERRSRVQPGKRLVIAHGMEMARSARDRI